MISWLIAHNQLVGVFALGIFVGVLVAAWRQQLLEDRRWEYGMRSNLRRVTRPR